MKKKKKIQTVRADSEDDSDYYDIAEPNCELAMVESQLCSIPYELYDLPDLTVILSIETWDSFLTEEERFVLSRFLPDMDQESFGLTMQALLGGAGLYFGNPVDKFYKKLRGGLFTPKVACCKEGVTFFKRRKYYYSLKFYHERMIHTFTEMQKLLSHYDLSNNARLHLWSGRRRQTRNLKLLDLNRVQSDEATTAMESLLTFPHGGSSKNTIKLKITKDGIYRYQDRNHHQSLPKGLLKVIPKPSSSSSAILKVAPKDNILQIHETGSMSNRFVSASPPYSGTTFEKPYGTLACSITELPKCLLNQQDHLESTTQSSMDRTESVLRDPTHTMYSGLGASITERNLLAKKEDYAHDHLKSPGFINTSSETMETKKVLSGKNFQRDVNVLRKPLHVLRRDNHHGRATEDDHLFSLTYKRRKVQRIGVA